MSNAKRDAAVQRLLALVSQSGARQVRLAWCDLHGLMRGKTVLPAALPAALRQGVGMVGTIVLKDTSDRTAWKVFDEGGVADLPGFEAAANLLLLPDPDSFRMLPWAPGTGWLRCDLLYPDGKPVQFDPRHQLQRALQSLAAHPVGPGGGLKLVFGLEVEFHIYRVRGDVRQPGTDPAQAAWPGPAPAVELLHPGYQLLGETAADRCDEALSIVRDTALGLGLPLTSLEIELGPSQVEAVFGPTDALLAADHMALFRSGVRQALARAGYHATFMCRPPFAQIMSSGWHLHQSVTDAAGRNLMARDPLPARPTGRSRAATDHLSALGVHWLAGLLAHAPAMAALAVPTLNGFERFRPNALAPQSIVWGQDNRGAMLRVVGTAGDAATHIENRLGEPLANPYLYLAAQVHAGLDGLRRALPAPAATRSPYAATHDGAQSLPTSLAAALEHLRADASYGLGFGDDFIRYYSQIKRQEIQRHADACAGGVGAEEASLEWQRREYFGRY